MSSNDQSSDIEVARSSYKNEADNQLAEQFGYKPQLVRKYGAWSSLSFAFSVGGLYTALMTTFAYPLQAGGPAAVVWCWFIAGASSLALSASVSEMISAYPTAAGVYYTISRLAPAELIPILSWITGWLNVFGQVAAVAATEYGAAQVLLSAVAVGSDFAFVPNVRNTIGVGAGLTVLTGLINSVSTAWMEKLTKTFVVFHVSVVVACFITLLAVEKNKNSAAFVFSHVESANGWSPTGFAFTFGFLSAAFTMTNYDATAHISEEIKNPSLVAPRATWWANVMTWTLGLILNIVLCFSKDPAALLANRIGQPVVQIFYDSLGKPGALAFTACGVITIQFTAIVCLQSLSRTIFAFSRDKMLPGSHIFATVNTRTGIPLCAVWASVVLPVLVSLIGLGSYQAIAAVFNVATGVLDLSYVIPIGCKLFFGRFERGPWHLGPFSKAVNLYSIAWTFFILVLFFMPTVRPVTAANMNYAVAIFGLIGLFAMIYWQVRGQHFYTGPIDEIIDGLEVARQQSTVSASAIKVPGHDLKDLA